MPSLQRRRLLALSSLPVLCVLAGCGEEKRPAPRSTPLAVRTVTVHAADEPHWIETVAQAEAGAGIDVKPQATGQLLRIACTEGAYVRQGDVLFEIDPSALSSALEAARAYRRQLESELDQAQRELRRARSLLESGAGTRQAHDNALSTRNQKQAALSRARADEASARIDMDHATVRAPVSGYVSRAYFRPGSIVVRESSVLATISQTDDVRAVFSPSDRDLGGTRITRETPVRVFRSDGRELPAAIDYVASTYDPARGTRTIRARIPENAGVLPGEFLRVRLQTTIDRGAWRVPQGAVRQLPDGTYAVFVLKEGRARRVAVVPGLWEGTDWVIRQGLADGDRVIVNQLLKLRDGAAVTEGNGD